MGRFLDHNKDMLVSWAQTILGDPDAAQYLWGAAVHWYTGDHFDALATTHALFPDKVCVCVC
jgi:glucosylceramidase